jgi:hypothetical protein
MIWDIDRTTHSYLISKAGALKLVQTVVDFAKTDRGTRTYPVDHIMRDRRGDDCQMETFPHVTYSPENLVGDIERE